MKQNCFLSCLLGSLFMGGVLASPNQGKAQLAQPVTIRDITNGVFSPKSAGSAFRSTADGKHYTLITPDKKAIVKYSYETAEPVDTLFNCQTATGTALDDITDYRIGPRGYHILLLRNPQPIYRRSVSYEAYHYDVRRNKVEPLSAQHQRVRIPTLSPNGRMCAFVADNDIYIKKFDYDTEVRVTTDGAANKILNGVTDWVYEEELYTTNLMAWSNASDFLTFVRTDETAVPMFDMTLFGKGPYPKTYTYKYPKAGEPNATVTLKHYNIETRETTELPLPLTEEFYIPRLEYHQDQLYTFTLNREQNHFAIYRTNPRSRVTKLWMEDKDDRYVDTEWVRQLTFANGGAYYVSETSGRPQVYRISALGTREAQLTNDEHDVVELYGAMPNGAIVYAVASPTPMERTLMLRDPKGKVQQLSAGKGYAWAVFSADLSYYLLGESDADKVPEYTLRRTRDAKVVATLEQNQKLQQTLATYAMPTKTFIQLKTTTGQTLNAWLLKPSNFNPNQKYPLVITQYSGPNSQSVLRQYSIGWEYALAEKGFVVACVDGRGTGARGSEFKKCTYLKMGILERNDQLAAANALGELPYVDKNRMGIFGWSFGGYMTLMCMTEGSGTFAAGVAVAPPTDWKLYDTIYTERYMRTPQQNPSGYKETSVLTHAENLKGHLLIVQGSADDNVHLQNTMQLTQRLVELDKDFDMMVYPDKNHSIYGGNTRHHLYSKIIGFFTRTLRP